MEIKDAVTVITGAGSGIGRSLALAMAREGADIVIADIDSERAHAVAAEVRALGRKALPAPCEVSREADIKDLVAATMTEFERIDCFVNNAGVVLGGPVEIVTDEDWQWIMGINFYAHVYAVRHVLPQMLAANRGQLVFTASAAGLIDTGTNIPYHVSKHAVVALAGGLAIDLKARGTNIGVSVICPEVVNTNLPERSFSAGQIGRDFSLDEQAQQNVVAAAMKARFEQRGMPPDEAARAIVAGLKAGRYLIYTHERTHDIVVRRMQDPEQGIDNAARVLLREQSRMAEYEEAVKREVEVEEDEKTGTVD